MDTDRLLAIFRETGALLEGHFLLSSGLHSNQYFQCAKVLQYPRYCELLCAEIASSFSTKPPDAVIAPALGGIVVGQEVGRQLGVRTMFAERKDGSMHLRRGFSIVKGERVLVCEDVVTTGGSVREVIEIVRSAGGIIAGVASIVDRSGGTVRFAMDGPGAQVAVMTLQAETYQAGSCPLCAQGTPVVKPGSRT